MNRTKVDARLPQLTEADIHRWAGPASFSRGRAYFAHGHVLDPCRQGNTLRARCIGSQPQPYQVEVELGPTDILSSFCSCPVALHCKHAVALLLTWLHRPSDFRVLEDLESNLQRRSQAELITLIRKMLARYPDLEMLLELPTPDTAGAHEPIDTEPIRRHVSGAFQYDGEDEWGTAYNSWMLRDLIEVGDTYTERGDWPNAAVVYQLVAEGVLGHYHTHVDHEGDLGGFVNDCAAGLGNCLAKTQDGPQRKSTLRALFEIYHWDVEAGGLGIGDQVPGIILEQATSRERQTVAQWIQDALASSRTDTHEFRRQTYGGFLLPLQGDYLDDESYLRLCRETARWQELVGKLLALGRENEALSVAAQVDDFYLPRLADIFVAQGYAEQIKMLVRQRAQASPNPHHQFHWWLKKRAQEEGDRAEELSLQEILFWQHPTLEGYQELHTLAEPLGCWDDLRSGVLARLDAAQNYALLTVIHLTENEIDLALETVEQVRVPHWQWTAMPLRVQVAQAAEKDHPRDAIRLYLQAAEDLISARGRENYVEAAGLLARVRALSEALGEPGNWQATILDLRERHRALRALKEELNRAGL